MTAAPDNAPSYRFAWVLTAVFLAFAGVSAWHHELWRDETQAWLIARDLRSLPALLEQAHYEGAPPLWSLMLYGLAGITSRPEIMQVLTWLLAGATLFLFAAYGPFNRLQKLLLAGNYYLLFEYGTVCRNYLPGVLALTLACVFYPAAGQRPWRFAAMLVLAMLASVHTLIVGVALAAAFWGVRILRTLRAWKKKEEPPQPLHWGALALVIAGGALAVYSLLPRADTLFSSAAGWQWGWNLRRLGKVCWAGVYACFPWPRPNGYFWIPPWDTPFASYNLRVAAILASALFASGVILFRRQAAALIFYVTGTLGVGAFLYVKYIGFTRHTGFLFLVFLFAWWLSRVREDGGEPKKDTGWNWWLQAAGALLLTAMLTVQAINGAYAVSRDVAQPFSGGKATARCLMDHKLDGGFIAVTPDWAGSPIAAYLNRPLYYPQAHRHGTFTIWNTRREDEITDEEFLRRAFQEAQGRETVVILNQPPSDELLALYGLKLVRGFSGSLASFEDHFIYRAEANAQPVN